jgi:hypothetical protein
MTGFGAALLGALSGGFGFVMLRGLDVVADPRAGDGAAALRYQGDLLFSRSYNVAFHNLAPPFPRDLAFALLISLVSILVLRARAVNAWTDAAAGLCLGLIGLTGGETFIVGGVLAFVVVIIDGPRRLVSLARVLGVAAALYAVWFVPIVLNYVELGGFVSITHIIPVALPATAILVSWGLATPLSLVGILRYGKRAVSDPRLRVCTVFVVVAVALLLASALIPDTLGDAFDTLGRKHRYWPIVYLSVALVGALGFTELLTFLRTRSRDLALVTLMSVTAIAWASPLAASLALTTHIGRYPGIQAAMEEEPGNLLHELRELGPGCNAATPQEVAREVFSFTGYRLVLWTGNWFGDNRARIRWTDIYDEIGSENERISDNKRLTDPDTSASERRSIAERYNVDVVIMGGTRGAGGATATAATTIEASYEGTDYLVLVLDKCGR